MSVLRGMVISGNTVYKYSVIIRRFGSSGTRDFIVNAREISGMGLMQSTPFLALLINHYFTPIPLSLLYAIGSTFLIACITNNEIMKENIRLTIEIFIPCLFKYGTIK